MMRIARIGAAVAFAVIACGAASVARAQAVALESEAVDISVGGPRPATIRAYLFRPAGDRPAPAIVAMHGCGGLLTKSGKIVSRERDWAERLVAAGYAVLLPDSFNPRGYREICTQSGPDRIIRPAQRAYDAAAAAAWLAQQPFVDKSRIGLLGWSNGGSTVVASVDGASKSGAAAYFKVSFAFYPGCRPAAERADYAPRVPLTILIGSSDDWTPPEPCRALAQRHGIRLIEYPGAVHAFDAPNSPRRTRTGVGLSARGDGKVQIGTDPEARAAAITEVMAGLAKAFAAPQSAR